MDGSRKGTCLLTWQADWQAGRRVATGGLIRQTDYLVYVPRVGRAEEWQMQRSKFRASRVSYPKA